MSDLELGMAVEETLEVADRICNDREIEFLESVLSQLKAGRTLSEKQAAWVADLYARACRSPY